MIKIITTRDMIRGVAERWRDQYWNTHNKKFIDIRAQLDALNDETATLADVVAIIGNDSWTKVRCDECSQEVDWVVQVGEDPDYESHTVTVCRSCLNKIVAYVNDHDHGTVGAQPDSPK